MIISRRNRDKLLGVAALITFFIGGCNALEFFLAGKNYLQKKTGVVEKVAHETYEGSKNRLYSKTTIHLKDVPGKFYLTDEANDGGNVEVAEGEVITIYARRMFQRLYNYDFRSNIFYVERNGEWLYNNLGQWKGTAFSSMCLYGGCALFLLVMYLDQVKNISISNWFQKRFLKKKDKKMDL